MPNLLEVQLDLLKAEIETIDRAIVNKDEATRQIKKWTITVWVAATGFVATDHLTSPEPGTYLWSLGTVTIPIMFASLEKHHKRIQRKFIWRAGKIYDFVNGPRQDRSLGAAIETEGETNFRFYDPGGENWHRERGKEVESKEFDDFINKREYSKSLCSVNIRFIYG